MKQIIVLVFLVGCKPSQATQRKLDKFDEFCAKTRMAIKEDRRAFEGDDPLKREAAYERFYDSNVIYHNAESVLMCTDELPKLAIGCHLNKNWACLADVAREIEGRIPSP